jgi:hypothetical protein
MIDSEIEAAHREAIAAADGQRVTVKRITGVAPNATVVSAEVAARVDTMTPATDEVSRTGHSATKPGAITQTQRKLLVMAADLSAQGYPLPVKKNDEITLADGSRLSVVDSDPHKRASGGAIEIIAAGVA